MTFGINVSLFDLGDDFDVENDNENAVDDETDGNDDDANSHVGEMLHIHTRLFHKGWSERETVWKP